jgi:parallel beta-helix repeat protein
VFLLGLSAFAFNVQSAKAQSGGTIVINPNGTISSPVTANITISENETYTFNSNNYLPIIVNRSNIRIDGRGYTLQGNGTSTGFSLTKVSNVTIKNTAITNSLAGIYLSSSSGDTLSGNNATRDGYGIELYSSSGNTLSGNNVTASYFGIFLFRSSGNVLSDNLMAGNTYNFYVYGSVLSDYINHVDTSNLVNGKPVYYLMNQSSIVISPQTCLEGVGYLGLVNCKNMTVQGLTLARNGQGLLLAFTNDTEINHVNVTSNSYGIGLYSSSGNTLSGNNVTANLNDGIELYSSSGNVLSGNNVTANLNDGIDLFSSPSNVLSGNNVTANTWDGIYLFFSSGNRIFHNDFVNNKH